MKKKNKIKYNGGAAMMILVFFFVFISLTILIGLINPVTREFKIVSDNLKSKESYFLSESGAEDVLYRMKNNLSYDTSENLVLGETEVTTTVSDISTSQKEITSIGDTNQYQRKVNLKISTGTGISFSYGIMTGQGGIIMDNNSQVIGNVYSNGQITGSGEITGSAMSANLSPVTSVESNGSGAPDYDISFGKTDSTQDFAQSFSIDETEYIYRVKLYIKKVSTPSNLTVRIVNNSGGSPGTTTLASGLLSASLISTNYGWVDVPFSSNPQLIAGTTYWLVVDGNTNSSKYYKIGANSNGYSSGVSKIGKYGTTWNNNSPSGVDCYFDLYTGIASGLIEGIEVGENSYAHTVNDSTIGGTNYCQTGSGNNKSCNTSRPDPVQVVMPISEQNIADWKEYATVGGQYDGNYLVASNTTLGPKKITGDLTINNKATLTVSGAIWVEGNMLVDNNAIIKLSSGYGSSEGLIIVDGTITIQNNSIFQGSGSDDSYILALSTSNSSSAISLGNNAGAVILYASNGTIDVLNNGQAKSLNGNYVHLNNNAVITYDDGIANSNFISGPSGSWNINGWKEVE